MRIDYVRLDPDRVPPDGIWYTLQTRGPAWPRVYRNPALAVRIAAELRRLGLESVACDWDGRHSRPLPNPPPLAFFMGEEPFVDLTVHFRRHPPARPEDQARAD